MNEHDISYSENIEKNIVNFFYDEKGYDYDILKLAYLYCLNCGLFDIKNKKISINVNGKLFLISDDISNTVEMIKYFWNNFKYNEYWSDLNSGSFNKVKSKKYLACLLLQFDSASVNINPLKYKNIDSIYEINQSTYNKLVNDSFIHFLIFKVFYSIGLINVNSNIENESVEITDAGRKVFEYFSLDMVDKYKTMMDESWEYYDRGDFNKAYDIAKNIVKIIGNMPEVYNLTGCIKIKEGEYDTARDTFLFALNLCEQDITKDCCFNKNIMDTYIIIYYNLGLCYFYKGDFIKAMHIFRCIKKTISYPIKSLDYIIDETKCKLIIK